MRFEEIAPDALARSDLRTVSGEDRLQYTAEFMDLSVRVLGNSCGTGAAISVLAALDGAELVAAIPLVRTSASPRPRPFPMDFEDYFFDLWIRNLDSPDRELQARTLLSRGLNKLFRLANPALQHAMVLHAPLSPLSDALVASRLPPARAGQALRELLLRARQIAANEDRCAFLPRGARRHLDAWGGALAGFTRVPAYSNAEYLPGAPPDRRLRQMIRRNARLMERASITVKTAREAPPGVPFGRLFAQTAGRHKDPAPQLSDSFFQQLGARFSTRVRFLCAQRDDLSLGFLTVLEQGTFWEAFKCGTDRQLAEQAPVYLDLLYGKLRDMAVAEGVTRVDLGPGDLSVKRHYGAACYSIDSFVVLPPGFRFAGALTAYLRAVGDGIRLHENAVPGR